MRIFRGILAVIASAILVLILAIPTFASWAYKFPVTIQDTSNVSRAYVPVLLGFGSQSLINSGYTVTGMDTNQQNGSTNVSYMMGTTQVGSIIPNLPAGGQVTVDLYTGYSPNQTGFPIIVGNSGYVTFSDDPNLEFGNNGSVNMSVYADTLSSGYLFQKNSAIAARTDGAGNIVATIGQEPSSLVQVIIGGSEDTLNSAATEYNALMGGGTWSAAETTNSELMPTPGSIDSLYIRLSAAVAGGGTYTFTLMKNSTPTALALTLTAGQSTGNTTNAVTFAAGDNVSLRSTATGAPGAPYATWSTLWKSSITGESIFLSNITSNNGATCYEMLQGVSLGTVTETAHQTPMPTNGTFKKLFVRLTTSPGGALDAYTFTLRSNTANTTLATTVTEPAITGNNTANNVAVLAGDLVNIMITPISGPANQSTVAMGMVFVSNTLGESVVMGGGELNGPNNAATRYTQLSGNSRTNWDAVEANRYQLTQLTQISKLYVKLNTAPDTGAGVQSYTFTVREAGGSTGLVVTISELATTGNDVINTYTSANGAVTDMESVPANLPTSPLVHWGLVSLYPSTQLTLPVSSGIKTVIVSLTGGWFTLQVGSSSNSTLYGGSVPDNGVSWVLMGNSVPYLTYYRHKVGVTELIKYEPNAMIISTNLPNLDSGGSYNGTINFGTNSYINIIYGQPSSYQVEQTTGNITPGFTLPAANMPATWFGAYPGSGNFTGLPFYPFFNDAAIGSGLPLNTVYFIAAIGFALALALLAVVVTRSALIGVLTMTIVLFMSSTNNVVPMWIPATLLIMDLGIMYLYRQITY